MASPTSQHPHPSPTLPCGGSPYPLNSVLILFSEEVFLSQAEGGVDADGGRRQLQAGDCTAVSCWDLATLFNTTVPGSDIVPGNSSVI